MNNTLKIDSKFVTERVGESSTLMKAASVMVVHLTI